mgnify:FL=1
MGQAWASVCPHGSQAPSSANTGSDSNAASAHKGSKRSARTERTTDEEGEGGKGRFQQPLRGLVRP